MSIELSAAENSAISTLWKAWESATDLELEANFKALDYTSFHNIIKYFRELGLSEEPAETKLHIMVPGGLRFTVIGENAIRDYCRTNSLKGKPFKVILKERKFANRDGLSDVDLNEYGVRIKLRREVILDPMNHRIVKALTEWNDLPKSFRYMKRYSYKSKIHNNIIFDASVVRESKKDDRGKYHTSLTFDESYIMKQPKKYEVEVEAFPGAKINSLLIGVVNVLRGLQRSYILTRASIKTDLLKYLADQTGSKPGVFPGAQPVTLHKDNIDVSIDDSQIYNICTGDYNVTDKADGLRCLLIIAKDGKLYLIDRSLNIYNTGRRLSEIDAKEWAGTILDGEWITQNADSKPICRYYAFDIFNGRNGEDITKLPFITRNDSPSRITAMAEAVAIIDNSAFVLASIPDKSKISFHMKTFRTPDDPTDQKAIFKECAAIMERLKTDKPYHTDGLIFTPNNAPLPKSGTWKQQFKWKPASMNSVDFLVITEKERDDDDKLTSTELISTQYREDTKQMMRCKTLRLFCGANTHPIFDNPRKSVLFESEIPREQDINNAPYRPIEFSPDLPDPMASICYVAINAGATDAAAAAPEAQIRAALDDTIYCEETKDPINDRTIVEMIYDPKKPKGWRWIPMRVRWDKTEQFAQRRLRGTMNSAMVANDVWMSIHNPVTEYMITTGDLIDTTIDLGDDVTTDAYYQKKAPQRDQFIIRELTEFHNKFIKQMLLKAALSVTKHASLIDLSVGQAGDLHKWIHNNVGFVLGCDIADTGINSPAGGAYRRYLDKMISIKHKIPPMLFVQADSSKRIVDGTAGITAEDKILLRTLWGEKIDDAPPAAIKLRGKGVYGFDVAALMFSIHYFFKNREMLDGLLRNLAETVKVGGLIVGCCFDGDAVASLLKDEPINGIKRGTENSTDIWTITKKYNDRGEGTVPASDAGLGMAIDVNFISIGETYTEYLVSFTYLIERMASIGFELLNADELAAMDLKNSSEMFAESHTEKYNMPPKVQMFSFLNRWFIFKRRTMIGTESFSIPSSEEITDDDTAVIELANNFSELPINDDSPATAIEAYTPVVDDGAIIADDGAIVADEIDSPKMTGGSKSLIIADGPIYLFNHRSAAAKATEMKLLKSYGIENKHWRRYLSTFTPFEFHDVFNPSIKYPSLEAAMSSAKYHIATNKPELGPQLFSTIGNIHQQLLSQIRKASITDDEIAELYDNEGMTMRDAGKPVAIKKMGAKFDKNAWEFNKFGILCDYVRQRYENDKIFCDILTGMQKQNAILVYNAGANELSGNINTDGEFTGDNLYGRALMHLINLEY